MKRIALIVAGFLLAAPAIGQQEQEARKEGVYRQVLARDLSAPQLASREPESALASTELIIDGAFETGSSPSGSYKFTSVSSAWTWQYSGTLSSPNPRYYTSSSSNAHSGSWCIYFDFGPATNRLYQTVTIPTGATATLSYWVKIGNLLGGPLDSLRVSIWNSTGTTLLRTVAAYDEFDALGFSWFKQTFDVSSFAGQTIRVQFDTSMYDATIFMVDDVSLTATTTSSSGCNEDTYTICLVNGRYRVTSYWQNQYAGGALANLSKTKLTDTTGAFWIANASTYEYMIRFNTATDNGKAWVAIPTFTDVEFFITVTDTVNGQTKQYHSAPGNRTLIYDPSFFVYP